MISILFDCRLGWIRRKYFVMLIGTTRVCMVAAVIEGQRYPNTTTIILLFLFLCVCGGNSHHTMRFNAHGTLIALTDQRGNSFFCASLEGTPNDHGLGDKGPHAGKQIVIDRGMQRNGIVLSRRHDETQREILMNGLAGGRGNRRVLLVRRLHDNVWE